MTDHGLVASTLPTFSCNIASPATPSLGGLSAEIQATASSSGRYGIAKVHFYYIYNSQYTYIGFADTLDNGYYRKTWTFPSCGECPGDQFQVVIFPEDTAGRRSRTLVGRSYRLIGRGC